jgi:hypothetical protein
MILILGDSWGNGENGDNWIDYNVPTHRGLHFFLEQAGYDVVNISVNGSSNNQILTSLRLFFASNTYRHLKTPVTKIFIFQTEWFRDYRSYWSHDVLRPEIVTFSIPKFDASLPNILLSQWQYSLSSYAVKYSIPIYLLGGCSDTMYLEKFEQEYPGLHIGCQSITNLCINNQDKIDNPVFGVRFSDKLLKEIRRTSSEEDFNWLLTEVDKGQSREKLWKQHPEWFWPSDTHGNRYAYQKLFNFLQERNILSNM